MGGYFNHTKHGIMELTRSADMRLVSLCNFDPKNVDGNYFNLRAWDVKKLKSLPLSRAGINNGLNNYYRDN